MHGKVNRVNLEQESLSSRVFGTLIFLLLAVYFRFIGGTWLVHINSYYHSVLNICILLLVFSIWIIWKFRREKEISLIGFEVYFGALALVIFLSTVFSENLSLSTEIAVGAIVLIFSIYIFLDIKKLDYLWDSLLNAILLTGAINVGLIFGRIYWWMDLFHIRLEDLFIRPVYVLKIIPRLPDLPNFNANVTAAYLILLLPIIIYRATTADKKIVKYLLWLFGFSALVVVVLTKSRGGYIGLIISLLASVVLYRRMILAKIKKNPVLSILITSGLGIAVLSGAIVVFRSRGTLLGASMLGRIEGWRIALQIIAQKPLLGTGLGGYGLRFLEMRDPEIYSLLNFHAHNEMLNIATSLGLVGLSVVLFIALKFIRIVQKDEFKSPDIRKAYLISLAGFMGMGLVDSYFDSSNIALIVIILLVGMLPGEEVKRVPLNKIPAGLLIVGLLILASVDIYANWRLYPYDDARIKALQGDFVEAAASIDEAIRRDPHNSFYTFTKAQINGEIICTQNSDPGPGIQLFEEVLPIYRNWGPININAASLYTKNGDHDLARSYIQNGINSDPEKALNYCLLGDNQLSAGLYEQALLSYTTCLSKDARWVDTPYWKSDKEKLAILDDTGRAMIENESPAVFTEYAEVAFRMDRFDDIKGLVIEKLSQDEYQPELGILYSRYLIDSGQTDKAITDLVQIIQISPRNSRAWSTLANGYLENGELESSLSAINISLALETTAENLMLSGLINSALGNQEAAKAQYSRALNWKRPSSSMSAWTARRFTAEIENLSCNPLNLTFRDFYDPAWQGLVGLAQYDCEEAKEIYLHIENELYTGFADRYGEFPGTCEN